MAEEETLVSRRSKRMYLTLRLDEEDVFESDFASTDDEAAAEDVDTGEKAVEDEERRARRSARARVEKATAAAHARQRVTFHPQAETSEKGPNKEPQKLKRRVSLGVAVNAETGEVIEGGTRQRQSQRSHTIMNTSATVNRMKDAEEKRQEALDTEEGNIIEHRDYLKLEEEKRARARVVRTALEGPVLRWISRKEQVRVEVAPPVPATYPSQYGFVYNPHQGTSYSGTQNYQSPFRAYFPTPAGSPMASQGLASTSQPQSFIPSANTPSQPSYYHYPVQPLPAPPPAQERNYIVHELSQDPSATKPLWKDTMSAMFGDEVKWDEVRVFTGKQRPLSRPVRTCPITGTPAKYLDPRTNVPFANIAAFKTLTRILSHDYVWSEALECYVTRHQELNHDVDEPMNGTITKRRRVDDRDGQNNEG
ncbi:hypothetical protein EDD22DRAFT_881122 [Suillus occidentalis]|nr:hypothetical protein EDD22DRAFT_881122 [Suillus occidentalis]